MNEFADSLGDFLSQNVAWAGPLIGLLTFEESAIVIGACCLPRP